MLFLILLVASFIGLSSLAVKNRLASSPQRERTLKARYVAEAGLHMTLARLRGDETLFSPKLAL